MSDTLFALIDCNSFFVSCERVFDPTLKDKPVVVLSSNDGCVISRSSEAKAMGIQMGQPFFMLTDYMKEKGLVIKSSNFGLYSDLSARVMSILSKAGPQVEIYSIDEAFIDFSGQSFEDAKKQARELKEQVLEWTGIPVSIGIGRTKTLSKLANDIAKKRNEFEGICVLSGEETDKQLMSETGISEVWGIGRQLTKLLTRNGIWTVADFQKTSHAWARKYMGVTGLRMLMELQGTSCMALDDSPASKKSIVVSRSFGAYITRFQELSEAVAMHAHSAGEKLRRNKTFARGASLFVQIRTGKSKNYQSVSVPLVLEKPTYDTFELIGAAQEALKNIFQSGKVYKKAGIILYDFIPEAPQQRDFFKIQDLHKNTPVMKVMDQVNQRMGRRTLMSAAAGVKRAWQARSEKRSQLFTSNWGELMKVRA